MNFLLSLAAVSVAAVAPQTADPERVTFASRDGSLQVTGYLYRPEGPVSRAGAPAIVMMAGTSGPYTPYANGRYDASTLSPRHKAWGEFWASRGFVALMVDDFEPAGFATGFTAQTYKSRPDQLNELSGRPLHAYGALRYLKALPGVDPDRIGLMGWSSGASAVLATMANDKPGDMRKLGFRAAVAFYPGCGLQQRFQKHGYIPYAPVRLFMGSADRQLSPRLCQALVDRSRGLGSDIAIKMYEGASHSFDAPIRSIQSIQANAAAKADAETEAESFFRKSLRPR